MVWEIFKKYVSCHLIHKGEVPLNVRKFVVEIDSQYYYTGTLIVTFSRVFFSFNSHILQCKQQEDLQKANRQVDNGSAACVFYLFANNLCAGILRHSDAVCFDERIHKLAEFTETVHLLKATMSRLKTCL